MKNDILEKAREESVQNLIKELGCIPDIPHLIEYLEEKAKFDIVGKTSPECMVNKEALRLAATYLSDAYLI